MNESEANASENGRVDRDAREICVLNKKYSQFVNLLDCEQSLFYSKIRGEKVALKGINIPRRFN